MNAVLKHPFFHENLHMNIDLMETPLNASVSFGEGQANDFSHIIKENKNVINSMIQTPTENKKVTKLGQHKVASDARPTTHESRLPPTYRRGSSVTNSVCNSLQNSETKENNKENHEFQSNYMNIHGNPAKKYASGKPTNGKHSRKGSLEKIDASTPQIAKNKPKELVTL